MINSYFCREFSCDSFSEAIQMPYLFTSESVSSGHPDKVADIISDTLLDYFLSFDSSSRVACETMVTTGQVIIAGEVTSSAYLHSKYCSRSN